MERKSFLDLPAPAGYVAGVGRGATGFTTRSDIGPAKAGFTEEDDEDDREVDESGLLSSKSRSKEDIEADKIYADMELRLQNRRKKRKVEENVAHTSVESQFADLKQNLKTISSEEWMNLPEPGDITRKNKRERELAQQDRRAYNVSDSLIVNLRDKNAIDSSIELLDSQTNFETISAARGKLLSSKLDSLGSKNEAVNSSNVILQSLESSGDFSVADISKSRAIFRSLRSSDPKNPIHWISSARIELQAKNYDGARKIISEGCAICRKNEEIWLENLIVNENKPQVCQRIIKEALVSNPKSEKLWMKAVDLENDVFSKKKVVQRGLRNVPESASLWKLAIEIEDDKKEVKRLLSTALEIVKDEDLWLYAIELEEDQKACKALIERAKDTIAGSKLVCLREFELEERNGAKLKELEILVGKTIKENLQVSGADFKNARKSWLKLAEQVDSPLSAKAIITQALPLGLDDSDYVDRIILCQDAANDYTASEHFELAKNVYWWLCEEYSNEIAAWRKFFKFLKDYGTKKEIIEAHQMACKMNPNNEELWLRRAKENWVHGEVEAARLVLQKALKTSPGSSPTWMAYAKLESSVGDVEAVVEVFKKAREQVSNDAQMWYNGCIALRNLKRRQEALELAQQGIRTFPDCDQLYLQQGEVYTELGDQTAARESYSAGIKQCKNSIKLWQKLAENLAVSGDLIKARSVIDRGISFNAQSDELWVTRANLEKNSLQIHAIIDQGLQKFPKSASLWAAKLAQTFKKNEIKKVSAHALSATDSAAQILVAVGAKLGGSKAGNWYKRATQKDRQYGDAWIRLYKWEKQYGVEEGAAEVVTAVNKEEPLKGEIWNEVKNDAENYGKNGEELLKKGVKLLDQED